MIILLQRKIKVIALVILLLAFGSTIALADDGEDGDDGDDANTVFPCNPAVEATLEIMDIDEECDFFDEMGVSPGELMRAWRLANMLEPDHEDAQLIWQDIMDLKTESGFGWGQIKMAYYLGGSVEEATALLDIYRTDDEKVGWGNLKKAKALIESGLYDGTLDEALTELESVGWGGIKPEDYSGPPPWSKGFSGDADFDQAEQFGNNKNSDNSGPPYGKALGHDKEKPDKPNNRGGDD